MSDVNYLAAKLNGDGVIEVIESDLPLNVTSTDERLSAPPTISGSIEHEVARLKKNGRPIFEPNNTAILVEEDGVLRVGGIYRLPTYENAVWKLNVSGFTSYAQKMPYVDATYFVQADPLDIFRHIWAHIQSQPHGDLGITVDGLTSPVRVGTELENVQFTAETSPGVSELVSFEAGPRKLNWYQTFDLGKEIDDYAKSTPFDWAEQVSWDGDDVAVHIALGYPIIGSRREDVTGFVLGQNLETVPSVAVEDSVTEVHVIGAGEGREAIRGFAGTNATGLRTPKVVEDKAQKSKASANSLAARVAAATQGQLIVDTIVVNDHPNAPLSAIELGSSYQLYAETPHALVDQYVRVVGRSRTPGKNDAATLTVVREAVA